MDGFTAAHVFTSVVKGFSLVWKTQLDGGVTASPLAAPTGAASLPRAVVSVNVTAPSSSPAVFDPVPGPDNLGGIY